MEIFKVNFFFQKCLQGALKKVSGWGIFINGRTGFTLRKSWSNMPGFTFFFNFLWLILMWNLKRTFSISAKKNFQFVIWKANIIDESENSLQISWSFCKSFLKIMNEIGTISKGDDFNTTELIVRLFDRVSSSAILESQPKLHQIST